MRLETLDRLFRAKNPKGNIDYDIKSKSFKVVYSPSGRVYSYQASSNYALAERLELIPELDFELESRLIADKLTIDNSVVGPWGCVDTVRFLLGDGQYSCICVQCGTDDYDRPLGKYSLVARSSNPWA